MKHPLFLLFTASLALVGCQGDQNLSYVKDYGGSYDSTLTGRVCDADSGRWLEGAVVYTHILNDADELIDTVETYTDADGKWSLEDLRGGQSYTVYVQYGNDIIDMFDIDVPSNSEVEVPAPQCGAALGRVAVITGHYDDWESVLANVGVTNYELIDGLTGAELAQFLADPDNLAEYSALFFAGGHVEEDVLYDTDGSDTTDQVGAVRDAVRDFVSAGGFVYASDWSYDLLELCWPDRVHFLRDSDEEPDAAQLGEPQTLTGHLVNSDLSDAVGGENSDVNFDLDTWPVMLSADSSVDVMQQASEITYRDGTEEYTVEDAPLLVQFDVDAGRVVFSSWRVAANDTDRAGKVIKYMLGVL